MLDRKYLCAHLGEVAVALARRGYTLDVAVLGDLQVRHKALCTQVQALQNVRNKRSKILGQEKAQGKAIPAETIAELKEVTVQLKMLEEELGEVQQRLQQIAMNIPNLLHTSVPDGSDETHNQEVRRWGEPTSFAFTAKDHVELGQRDALLDCETAAKISGSRFVVLRGPLARLHRALGQFMLDMHTQEHGYQEVYVPYLVSKQALYGTGQLPKFAADQFDVTGSHGLSLIPTAEVPLTNLVRDSIQAGDRLPLKFVTHTPCFRSESGSHGKDTRGMLRQHQFDKVELVQLVAPVDSYAVLEALVGHAEAVLQRLELPYRVMNLCAGEVGFSAAKTYDLEVWLPGQHSYREISSCSNFESFQARRMQARWRDPQADKPQLLHSVNGSGLAVGRTLIAIMENYQDEAGRIHIPKVLYNYMGGVQVI